MQFHMTVTIHGECPDDAEPEHVRAEIERRLQRVTKTKRAEDLGVSDSYLSLMEHGKRPILKALRDRVLYPFRVEAIDPAIHWFTVREGERPTERRGPAEEPMQ